MAGESEEGVTARYLLPDLPDSIAEEDVRNYFSVLGELEEVNIKQLGGSKRMGSVKFSAPTMELRGIMLDEAHFIEGHQVSVITWKMQKLQKPGYVAKKQAEALAKGKGKDGPRQAEALAKGKGKGSWDPWNDWDPWAKGAYPAGKGPSGKGPPGKGPSDGYGPTWAGSKGSARAAPYGASAGSWDMGKGDSGGYSDYAEMDAFQKGVMYGKAAAMGKADPWGKGWDSSGKSWDSAGKGWDSASKGWDSAGKGWDSPYSSGGYLYPARSGKVGPSSHQDDQPWSGRDASKGARGASGAGSGASACAGANPAKGAGKSAKKGPEEWDVAARYLLSDLPEDATEENLRSYFGTFGPIEEVTLKQLGQSQHGGFVGSVKFINPTMEMRNIMLKELHEINGIRIRVETWKMRKLSRPGNAATPVAKGGAGAQSW